MMAETATQPLVELWRRQIEEGTQAWLRMIGQTVDPDAFWRPFMDQSMAAWSKLMTEGAVSPDLMAQWKQFLDLWIAAWSRLLEQAMSTETFARAMGAQLEVFLLAAGPVKRVAGQQVAAGLTALGMPSRSQVVGLAEQLVQLEEKVDRLEDRLEVILKRLNELGAGAKAERP
jgi:hypothetical protein